METPRREDAEQLRYAPPHWSCTGYYGMGWYWISLSHSSNTHCRAWPQPYFNRIMCDHTGHSLSKGTSSITSLNCFPWPARSPDLSPIENMWYMVVRRLTQITPPAATPDQLWQRVEAAWSAAPEEHIQSLFESMPRCVAARADPKVLAVLV
ncbi:transposable element Tcb1 transposase [Trichonephila clavipes]|nr:transposable element Tcb1 transposase [Trichonephila clavipes]